jgi:hypothetical protein
MSCIQSGVDAIPAQMPLPWDSHKGTTPRWKPWRKAVPNWLVPQFTWFQRMQIPGSDENPVDMTVSDDAIWVAYRDWIFRYGISTESLAIYDLEKQYPLLRLMDILITEDKIVWVAGVHSSENQQYLVILRYDPIKDSFIAIEDVDRLLNAKLMLEPKINRWDYVPYYGQNRILKVAANNKLLFLFRGAIYSYNPLENKAEFVYGDPDIIISALETDPRGIIWFTVEDDDRVWMISSESDQPKKFELQSLLPGTINHGGEYFGGGYTLYLDSHERLWIPGWGYLDTSKQEFTWHFLSPSPLFINLYDSDYVYIWGEPDTYEMQDGSIWFNFENGLIHYDLETGYACWISPQYGQITQTPNGTIWIMLEDQLYKYAP